MSDLSNIKYVLEEILRHNNTLFCIFGSRDVIEAWLLLSENIVLKNAKVQMLKTLLSTAYTVDRFEQENREKEREGKKETRLNNR